MDLFGTLGVALGLAMLAGVNLYLTIFITGLAVKLEWFSPGSLAAALEGFGHPAVIAVALGLFVVQFIADKIPWVDSLWDSIHTFLKPAGGVLLALTSLGPDAGAVSQGFIALLALAGSLLTHGVKASTRLTINTSPEPFSNIGASVAEDLLVIGGFMLVVNQPATAFFVFASALALFIYLTPRVSRSIRAILWLIWKKLRVPAGDKASRGRDFPTKLSADAEELLLDEFGSEKYTVAWCVPCVTGKTRNAGKLCRNLFGDLVAIRERSGKIFFIGSRNFKRFVEVIDLGGTLATHESRFISEGIVIHSKHSKFHANIRFHRGQEELAERLTDYLQGRIAVVDARAPGAAAGGDHAPAAPIKTDAEPESTAPAEAGSENAPAPLPSPATPLRPLAPLAPLAPATPEEAPVPTEEEPPAPTTDRPGD